MNDEVPVFINTPHPFLASVPESAMPGTTVYNLVARDVDENSDVRYFVQTGVERFGMVWFGLVWSVVGWCGVVWIGIECCRMV